MPASEEAADLLVQLRWRRAIDETRDLHEMEIRDRNPGDHLLADEFLQLTGVVHQEMRFAARLNRYKISYVDTFINPLFNDPELYTFIGSLYLARLLEDPVNRSAFLSSNRDEFSEEQLLKLVRRCSIDGAEGGLSSKLARLTNKVLATEYITHSPPKYTVQNEHLSPLLEKLRERQRVLATVTDEDKVFHARVVAKHFHELEKEIVNLYELERQGPYRQLSEHERCSDEKAFSLPAEEAGRLLAAARMDPFLYDLISRKPQEAKCLSHEQALFECAEHARLWLFSSSLRIYYNFSFTYADIGKAPASCEEMEAWSSPVGFLVKLPSFEEKRARRAALASHRDVAEWSDLPLQLPQFYMECAEGDLPEKVEALTSFLKRQAKIARRKQKRERKDSPACMPQELAADEPSPGNDSAERVSRKERSDMFLRQKKVVALAPATPEALKDHRRKRGRHSSEKPSSPVKQKRQLIGA